MSNTDIVVWLRGLAASRRTSFGEDGMKGCRYEEAANEIERLRSIAGAVSDGPSMADIKSRNDRLAESLK